MVEPAGDVLSTRIVVGAGLVAVTVAALVAGGLTFTVLVTAAGLLMSAEWSVMHGISRGFRLASLVALALVAGVTTIVSAVDALFVLAASAGLIGLVMSRFDRARAFWVALGLVYCGLPLIALLWLRAHPQGVAIVAWLFAIVWATDIAAFFAGRTLGGRRLAPAISPNKTVAGLIGGVAVASIAGALVAVLLDAHWAMDALPFVLAGLGGGLALLAQAGDLFESWLKRRAGVKDSGTLLPGHGGVLDRLDGLVPVSIAVALLVAASPPDLWK